MIQNKEHIQSLSMWRTIACLMVFAVHLGQRLGVSGPIRSFTDFGAYGVQLFFIISGFLIVKSYYDYGKERPFIFYAKKAIALLPLYYIVILYYFIMHTFVFKDVPNDPTGFGWFRYIIPINYILPKTGLYFWDNLGITWTIPYFMIAYAIFPILLKVVKGLKSSLIMFIVNLLLLFLSRKGLFYGWFSFVELFPSFIIGAILYYAIKEEKTSFVLFGATSFTIVLWIFAVQEKLLCSCLFAILLISTKNLSIKSKLFNKLLVIGDKYSYTMYLAHGIIFIHILDRYNLHFMIELLIAVIGTILLTCLIKLLIEGPLQKLLRKGLKNRKQKKQVELK